MKSILESIGLIQATDKLLSQKMIDVSERTNEFLSVLSSPAVIDHRQIVTVEYPANCENRLVREVWDFDQSTARQISVIIDSKIDPIGIFRSTKKWRMTDFSLDDPAREALLDLSLKLFDMSEEVGNSPEGQQKSHQASDETKELFAKAYHPHESNYTLCFQDDKNHKDKFIFCLGVEESLDDLLRKWERFCQQNYIYPDAVQEIYVGEN